MEKLGDKWQTVYPGQLVATLPVASGLQPNEGAAIASSQSDDSNRTLSPEEAAAAATAPPPTPVIAGFEVLTVLGRGAMGVVYKARQLSLNRLVALKMILAGSHAGPQERARFLGEAEAVAALQHPNIIQVYAVGEYDGMPYFSMEVVEGGSLDRRAKETALAADEAASLVEKLARAMHYAHQRGVIHRDLKPANILLTTEGEPKITDFGLAKRLERDPNMTEAGYVTQTGAAIGTPSYMAPEQAEGKRVGPLADVYSLGAVLYELLTFRPPFVADSVIDTLLMVVKEEPPSPASLQPHLPRDLVTICMKCLRKEQDKRYGTAADLADDLRRYLEGKPIHAVPVGSGERLLKWAKRHPALAALVVVSFLATLTLFAGGIAYQARLNRALSDANGRLVRLHVASGMALVDSGRLSSSLPLFVEALRLGSEMHSDEKMHRLRLAMLLRECPRLPRCWFHEGPAFDVNFSPSGDQVVSSGADDVARIWDVATGELVGKPLEHDGDVRQAMFSPNGKRVLTASEDGTARVWELNGSREVCRSPKHGGVVVGARFSTDGQRFCTASTDGTTRVCDSNTGRELIPALKHPGPVRLARFSPDDRLLLTVSEQAARLWDATTGMPAGATSEFRHDGKQVRTAAFNNDSTRLVTGGDDNHARQWDVTTGQQLAMMKHQQAVVFTIFSPDGTAVATASNDGTARVWKAGSGEWVTSSLTHNDRVVHVAFSSDGRTLATASSDNTTIVWDAATGMAVSQTMQSNGNISKVRFSPNDRYVLTASESGAVRMWHPVPAFRNPRPSPKEVLHCSSAKCLTGQLEATSADGYSLQIRNTMTGESKGAAITPGGKVYAAIFSPDGKRLLTANSEGKAHLWDTETGLMNPPVAMVHGSPVLCGAFSPDGTLVATGSSDNTSRIWSVTTGEPAAPFMKQNASVYRVVFSPDGLYLLAASEDGSARLWDVARGERLTPSLDPNGWVREAFTTPKDPDVWKLTVEQRPIDELQAEAEWLSATHIEQSSGGLVPNSLEHSKALQERIRIRYPRLLALTP